MTNYVTSNGVQAWTITIPSGSASASVTLLNALGAGGMIYLDGINPAATTNFANAGIALTFNGVDTITATRNTSTTNAVVVQGNATDGDPTNLVVGVQYGTVTISARTSGTASVTAPGSDANTALHHLGSSGTDTTLNVSIDFTRLSQSGGTVTCNSPSAGTTTTAFGLYEYRASCLTANAVQRVAASSSSLVTSYTASLAANVVMANTICLSAGFTTAGVTSNPATGFQRAQLTAVGTITINMNTSNATAKNFNISVIEHNSGVLNSAVQRGTLTLTGVTAANTTLGTLINPAYSALSYLGDTSTSTTGVLNRAMGAISLGYLSNAAVRNVTALLTPSSTSTISVTIPSTAAGSTLVVCVHGTAGAVRSVSSVTDSASQTYTQVSGAAASNTTLNGCTDIWYFKNTASGVTSVTATMSGAMSSGYMTVYELTGMSSGTVVDVAGAVSNHSASATQVSPPLTTTDVGDILIANAFTQGSSQTVAAPYTHDNASGYSAYYIPSAIVTSNSASFSANSNTYCSSGAAFFASGYSAAVFGTKNNATANITISYEAIEYAAYIPPSGSSNAWYPTINYTPMPLTPGYVFMGSLADEVLNLPIPFLPKLPDVPPINPPAPPSSVAMNVQAIITITPLRFFPRIADAPKLTPADRPNFFSPIFPLNFRLPWLPARGVDAPPITPPDKPNYFAPSWLLNLKIPFLPRIVDAPLITPVDRPNYFAPRWLLNIPIPWLPARGVDAPPVTPPDKPNYFAPGWALNFKLPWQPRIVDAAPRALAAVPNFFAGIPAIVSAVVSIPWFPRVSDAPPITPPDKPNYFAPRWLLNLPVPWMHKISTDAPPVTPPDKPNFFSPIFALNFRLPWLPRVADAPPVTPQAKPNFFAGIPALNFRLPWLPRISDAPPVTPPDRPSIFSFPLPLNLKLPWLIRVSDAPASPPAHKQAIFMPAIRSLVISWFPRVSDAAPVAPAIKQSIFSPPFRITAAAAWFTRFISADAPVLPLADKPNFFSLVFRFVPGSGVFGRIIDPMRQNRTISPKMQSRTIDPALQSRVLNPDSDGRILDPRSQKRIL